METTSEPAPFVNKVEPLQSRRIPEWFKCNSVGIGQRQVIHTLPASQTDFVTNGRSLTLNRHDLPTSTSRDARTSHPELVQPAGLKGKLNSIWLVRPALPPDTAQAHP